MTQKTYQQILHLHFPPVYGAHDFVVASCNQQAYRWVKLWPQWPHLCSVISGPSGTGKTHLGHMWAQRARALILTTRHFLEYSPPDLCALAPAFFWDLPCFKGLEEPFFHFYNALIECKKSLLMVHAFPPYTWDIGLPDVRSRVLGAPHIPITLPEDDLLEMILRKLFLDFQIYLPPSVAEYILKRCTRSCRDLQDIAYRLAHHAHSTHNNLTTAMVRNVLGDML